MDIAELKNSRFLTKEDCDPPIAVTIAGDRKDNVAPADAPADMKYVLDFEGDVKSMVLNSTNAQLIAKFLGSRMTEDWVGKQVVLYCDEGVMFQGKPVGGIRVRRYDASTEADVPW